MRNSYITVIVIIEWFWYTIAISIIIFYHIISMIINNIPWLHFNKCCCLFEVLYKLLTISKIYLWFCICIFIWSLQIIPIKRMLLIFHHHRFWYLLHFRFAINSSLEYNRTICYWIGCCFFEMVDFLCR